LNQLDDEEAVSKTAAAMKKAFAFVDQWRTGVAIGFTFAGLPIMARNPAMSAGGGDRP